MWAAQKREEICTWRIGKYTSTNLIYRGKGRERKRVREWEREWVYVRERESYM